ncbi:hypothetical protein NW836_11140 [Synechococcus sp. H60.4]
MPPVGFFTVLEAHLGDNYTIDEQLKLLTGFSAPPYSRQRRGALSTGPPSYPSVLVYRSAHEPKRLLKSADTLDREEVIPGFQLPLAALFQKLPF